MSDLDKEESDLAEANEHIAAGEQRLAKQIDLIRELEERRESTVEAEKVLHNYEEILKTFRIHRQLIVDTIKRV